MSPAQSTDALVTTVEIRMKFRLTSQRLHYYLRAVTVPLICTASVCALCSFSDLAYADDAAFFLPHHQDSTEILSSVCSTATLLRLHVSQAKTKLQNLGSGPGPAAVSINGILIKPMVTFVYLSSLRSSDGYCWPDMKHRIGLAATPHPEWWVHLNPNKNQTLPGFDTSLCFRDLDSLHHWYEDTRGILLEISLANPRGSLASTHN